MTTIYNDIREEYRKRPTPNPSREGGECLRIVIKSMLRASLSPPSTGGVGGGSPFHSVQPSPRGEPEISCGIYQTTLGIAKERVQPFGQTNMSEALKKAVHQEQSTVCAYPVPF